MEVLRQLGDVERTIPQNCTVTKLELIQTQQREISELQAETQCQISRLQAENQEKQQQIDYQDQKLIQQRTEIEQLSGQLRSLELQPQEEGSQRSRLRDVSAASPKKVGHTCTNKIHAC